MSIFLALLHHPVLNRLGERSTTAVTNVDMHDIARAARTYGVTRFFIVTPIVLQQELCKRVVRHWTEGAGGLRNVNRQEAFELVEIASDLDTTIARITELSGSAPELVASGAGFHEETLDWPLARERCRSKERPTLLLLGTGWGLHSDIVDRCDYRLPAIVGPMGREGYNHLSVRSAASILLDRLLANIE